MPAALASLALVDDWPGGGVAVVVLGADGVIARHGPTTTERPFASVTKLFTALACAVALEEGVVSYDDPLGPPGSSLAHLLAHASGLAPDDAQRVLAAPGTRRIYSNAGYEIAAAHVAARSGIPFADYLAAGVLEPLGCAGVALAGSPAHGAAGSCEDLALLAAELAAPRLVHAETAARMRAVAFPGLAGVVPGFGRQDPCDWGLGPEIAGAKRPHWTGTRRSPATFGHFGQSGSFIFVDPDAALACACLCAVPFGPWATVAWPALCDALLAELGVAARPASSPGGVAQ